MAVLSEENTDFVIGLIEDVEDAKSDEQLDIALVNVQCDILNKNEGDYEVYSHYYVMYLLVSYGFIDILKDVLLKTDNNEIVYRISQILFRLIQTNKQREDFSSADVLKVLAKAINWNGSSKFYGMFSVSEFVQHLVISDVVARRLREVECVDIILKLRTKGMEFLYHGHYIRLDNILRRMDEASRYSRIKSASKK